MKRFLILLAAFAAMRCASGSHQTSTPTPEVAKAAGYSAESANQPVGVIPAGVIHDAQRNKDLEVSIDYPAKGGPYPLLVFSHDYGSSDRAYEQLVSYWTTNGYVVARPKHADARIVSDAMRQILGPEPGQETTRGRRQARPTKEEIEKRAEERRKAEAKQMADVWTKEREPQWRDRALDVDLVVDSLDQLEQRYPELKGKIDHNKIAVAGHGLGAFTAMLAGGMKTFSNPPLSLADPKIKAVLALSPPGVSENRGLTAQSWADMKLPVMFMAGSAEHGATESEDWNWRKTAYANAPAGDKYFVLLQGGTNSTFLGTFSPIVIEPTSSIGQGTPANPRGGYYQQPPSSRAISSAGASRGIFSDVRMISLAFFDDFLKGESKGKDFLDTKVGQLGNVTVERK